MDRSGHNTAWITGLALCGAMLPGCFAAFSQREAREVSREKLLQVSEKGTTDHLKYVGSDFNYHYVYDTRSGHERSYKIRVTEVNLADTFPVGEDSYVLHPWIIEGKRIGTTPDDLDESLRKAAKRSRLPSGMGGPAEPVVQGPAESDVGEEVGDDQVEPGGVESP